MRGDAFRPALAALAPRITPLVPTSQASARPEGLDQPRERVRTLAELYGGVQTAGWRLFSRISAELNLVLNMPVLAQRLLGLLCAELDVSGASLSILEDGGKLLRVVACEGQPALVPVGGVLPRGLGLPWSAIETASTLVVPDVSAHPPYVTMQDEEKRAGLYLPLVAGTGTQGVLALYRPAPQTFGAREVAYLEAVAGTAAELLALSRLHAELEQAVRTDVVTEAGSRQYGLQRLAEACAHAERSGQACAVVMLDLDGFKQLNDRYGHQAGDEVLREAAGRLRRELRAGDVLARYGGDEFFVVVEGTSATAAAALLRRLVATSASGSVGVAGHQVPLPRWSAGVAVWPEDGRSPEELVRAADLRLYRDKRRRTLSLSDPETSADPETIAQWTTEASQAWTARGDDQLHR